MSAADFLLSPEVQQLLKCLYAEPARQFPAAELASASGLALPVVESTLAHLLTSGILSQAGGSADEPPAFQANTSFLFYAELRRIALKSFAAAEPLQAMLKRKFKDTVRRAFILGEDPAEGTVELLVVYGEEAPDKEALGAALHRLRKTGAVRQHLQVQVMSEKRFQALQPDEGLGAKLANGASMEIYAAAPPARRKPTAAQPATGLLEKARQRLLALAGQGGARAS